MEHHILSPTGFRNALMDSCIFYKLIHFYLPLSPAIHRMGNVPNLLCSRCKEKKSLSLILYCTASFPKLL